MQHFSKQTAWMGNGASAIPMAFKGCEEKFVLAGNDSTVKPVVYANGKRIDPNMLKGMPDVTINGHSVSALAGNKSEI